MDKTVTSTDGATANSIGVGEAQPEKSPSGLPQLSDIKPRTPGLRLFDFLLYPVFTNIGVFGLSVAATYLTTRGGDRNAAGQLAHGKVGEFFFKRGEWMINKFKAIGMNHEQADMSKMVFFSFFDGSLLAPFVKMFEDRREKIACAIDHQLGTTPEDLSVYAAEPKQTWLSVLGGRLATAAIVVPTAVALDKTGLNKTLFRDPGMQMGDWLMKKPLARKLFGSLDIKELSRISLFEAFYTSVCTTGLYVSSRFIAKHTGRKHEPNVLTIETPALTPSPCAIAAAEPESREHSSREHLKRPRIKPSGNYREYLEDTAARSGCLAV